MNSPFAQFKTEVPHDFWIRGFREPIRGTIENVEFFAKEDTVETYLTIVNGKKRFSVNLKDLAAYAEDIQQAA